MLKKPTAFSRLTATRTARLFLGFLLLILPTRMVRPLANFMGHVIAPRASIGFSLLMCERIALGTGTRIGHLNFIQIRRILLRRNAKIRHLNVCRGPLDLVLGDTADIGNRNTVTRAPLGVTSGTASFWLEHGAKATAGHSLDCTRSIKLGVWSTLAGKGSQIWTHGYVHEETAPKRYRVDGKVQIGSNVYIGSSSIITGGVTICDNAIVGVGSTVAKHLTKPGFYVSAPLRMLPRPAAPASRDDMVRCEDLRLLETVYEKIDGRP